MTSTNWLDLIKDSKTAGPGASREPIPAGDYEFKVLEATSGTTGNGKAKYTIKNEVQAGPHAGRLIWADLIISPESAGAMAFFFRKMKAMGLDEAFFSQQPSDDQVVNALRGRTFRGKVGIRNWNNQDRNEITEFHPSAGVGVPGVAGGYPAQAPAPAPQAAMPAVAPAPAQAPAMAPEQPYAAPQPAQAPATAPAPAAPAAPAQGNPWDTPPAPAPQGAPPTPF